MSLYYQVSSKPEPTEKHPIEEVLCALGAYGARKEISDFCEFVSNLESPKKESLFGATRESNLPEGILYYLETPSDLSSRTLTTLDKCGYNLELISEKEFFRN